MEAGVSCRIALSREDSTDFVSLFLCSYPDLFQVLTGCDETLSLLELKVRQLAAINNTPFETLSSIPRLKSVLRCFGIGDGLGKASQYLPPQLEYN